MCPACEAEWWAGPHKCDFCGKDFTPRKLGQRFCPGGTCKKKWTIQQNAQKLAELRKGKKCKRKGYPNARNPQYRIDCPNVVDAKRSDQDYCSDACREIAGYIRNQESRKAAAKARYAKDPDKPKEAARKRRAANPEKARESDRARYPIKRARAEAKLAAKIVALAKAQADRILAEAKPLDDPRITLAVCLERQGLKGYGLSDPLFFDVARPKSSEQREARQDRRKKLYKRHPKELERERQRVASLSENEVRILAEEARSRIKQQD